MVIAFFNGVKNTHKEALNSRNALKVFYGEKTKDDEKIRYELLYNETIGFFEDVMEVFEQKIAQQEQEARETLENRYELFFDVLNGGSFYYHISELMTSIALMFESFIDHATQQVKIALIGMTHDSPTAIDYAEHKTRIDNWIIEGNRQLFVAHSQGNLFANAAYDYAVAKVGENSVRTIHIAPPTSVLKGPHVLADLDIVINALNIITDIPSVTHSINNFLVRHAGSNGKKDILGHGFVEIYINLHLPTSVSIAYYIDQSIRALTPPPSKAQGGFFTATLTWDGSGDVDLHAYEPLGAWVYFRQDKGQAGYLDVDNVYGYGPEHYYASCDTDNLQEGTYDIKVANFDRADGKTATVQIASYEDGVLGTQSMVLGRATRDDPAFHVFSVLVSKDNNTGLYKASLQEIVF
jgi:hypothetical protein